MSLSNPTEKNDFLAYIYSCAAQALFPIANIYGIEHNFSSFEINLMRGIVVIIFTLAYAKMYNIDLGYSLRHSFWILNLRNMFMVLWVFTMTTTYYYLSFAVINSINICGSLLVFVWDAYIYKITINKSQKIGVGIGLIGAIIMINADYLFSLVNENFTMKTDFKYSKSTSILQTVTAASCLFISIIGMSLGYSITKSIKIKKSGSEYNLHFGFLLFIFSSIGLMHDTQRQIKPWSTYIMAYLLTGIPLTIATKLFSVGISLTNNTGIFSLFMTVSVIVSYFIDIFRYKLMLNPFAAIGSILITAGITLAILKKDKNVQKENVQKVEGQS